MILVYERVCIHLKDGVVVQLGLRFAPGAREVRGSNPRDPTTRIIREAFYLLF